MFFTVPILLLLLAGQTIWKHNCFIENNKIRLMQWNAKEMFFLPLEYLRQFRRWLRGRWDLKCDPSFSWSCQWWNVVCKHWTKSASSRPNPSPRGRKGEQRPSLSSKVDLCLKQKPNNSESELRVTLNIWIQFN